MRSRTSWRHTVKVVMRITGYFVDGTTEVVKP